MNPLTRLRLPGGIELLWSTREWVHLMLTSDSYKKRVTAFFIGSGLSYPLETTFDGILSIAGRAVVVDLVLDRLGINPDKCVVDAVFVNARRHPPRVYAWLHDTKHCYFLKIGLPTDADAFENERLVSAAVQSQPGLLLPRALNLVSTDRWVALLSQGLSAHQLRSKRKLNASELIQSEWFSNCPSRGPFGGIVHCDLASNNVYAVGNSIWVTDWELSALEGPDFCDLVCLAVADLGTVQHSLTSIQERILRHAGIAIEIEKIGEALTFLDVRGNVGARRVRNSLGAAAVAGQ